MKQEAKNIFGDEWNFTRFKRNLGHACERRFASVKVVLSRSKACKLWADCCTGTPIVRLSLN